MGTDFCDYGLFLKLRSTQCLIKLHVTKQWEQTFHDLPETLTRFYFPSLAVSTHVTLKDIDYCWPLLLLPFAPKGGVEELF